jgi:hypothetical protein
MTTIGGVTYNPSAAITLSAKVTSLSGGTVPTGTIQFYDETNTENTGSPVTMAADGTASYTETGQFSVGGHNIQAIYSGDSTYAAGESQPVTINIQPSPSTLIVTPSTTTPAGGSTITVTGVVTSSNPGASPPSGTLTVNLDGIAQGSSTLATTSGKTSASVSVTVPSGGAHTVQGIYSGDSNYNNATSPSVTITVAKSATTTSISATPSTLTAGVPETLTAIIAPADTTILTYTITGTVAFYDGTTLLGTAAIVGNSAVLASVSLSASVEHIVTAVYSGDTTYSASQSSPLILEPVVLPVTVTLTSSTAIIAPGQPANLTATVTPVSTPAATAEQHPTGNVYFYAGTTLIGEAALAAGTGDAAVGTLSVPRLPAGVYTITAVYAGDLTYGTATSNSLSLQVEDFTITCTAADGTTNLNMVQGTTATASCYVVSAGGFSGPIQVVCVEQDPPKTGAIECGFPPPNPGTVQGTGTVPLTIITSGGMVAANLDPAAGKGAPGEPHSKPGSPLWPLTGGAALAFAGLMLSPLGRRARIFKSSAVHRVLALALLLACLAGAGIGCTDTVTLNKTPTGGTPLGVATLKISAAAEVNTVTVTHYAYFTVDVCPTTGCTTVANSATQIRPTW